MATSIIDPDMGAGYDFASLVLWEASLGSISEPEIAQCRCTGGTADPGKLTISGISGNSDTNYLKIVVEDGYRLNGGTIPTSGNTFRCRQTSDGVPFRTDEAYLWVDGIGYDFAVANSRDLFETISTTPSGWIIFENCIGYNSGGGCSRAFDIAFGTGITNQNYYVINCISIDMVQYGIALGGASSSNTAYVYNCTVRGVGTTAMRTYTITAIAKNCIVQDMSSGTDGWSSSWSASSDTNCSDTADTPGSNVITGEVTFEGETSGDLRLSASDTTVKGLGLDLRLDGAFPFDYDIAGNKRGKTWDLGAYQVTPAFKGYHLMV